jgi:N-acyl homoserine lactone hydrolase
MKMHCLSGGRVRMRKSVYVPDADRSEMIEMPVSCMLLRHRQGNVLFDTGCHPSVPDNPAHWQGMEKFMTPIMPPGDNVLTGLSCVGLTADDIDVVVCSHLHPDHCGCNAFFKRATVIIHAREIEAARAPGAEAQGYLAAEWDLSMRIDPVDGSDRDLFGDGRIVLLHLPGHTPGLMSALVHLDRSGAMLLASDTVSLREALEQGIIPKNTWNVEALEKSLAEIRRIAADGTAVICGHDDRQWQTLRKGADAYD